MYSKVVLKIEPQESEKKHLYIIYQALCPLCVINALVGGGKKKGSHIFLRYVLFCPLL